jgi:hypothetical protein
MEEYKELVSKTEVRTWGEARNRIREWIAEVKSKAEVDPCKECSLRETDCWDCPYSITIHLI